MLSSLICAHLVGDFLLQNDWMQRKSKNSLVCAAHVAIYSIPLWLVVWWGGLPLWAMGLIMIQHWFQDRYALHLKWMEFYRQTTAEKWAVGPLCMDQAWHIGFIWLIVSLVELLDV